jgi:hypothetical protein
MISRCVVALLAFCSCTSNSALVPCADLGWLDVIEKTIAQNGNKGEIYSYRYKNETVYEINECLGCADNLIIVLNCGKKICEFGGIAGLNSCPDFYNTATGKKLVWKN